MANSYLPRRDADASAWMRTFAQDIAANPAEFPLSPSDAAAIQDAVAAFGAAFALSSSPATRTATTVADKSAGTRRSRKSLPAVLLADQMQRSRR